MKNCIRKICFVLFVTLSFIAVSCKKKSAVDNQIVVGASPAPHAQILNILKDDLKDAGYELIVREFTDYITPNEALESGEIDANYFQHIPYMDSFNQDRGFHLVNVLGVHIEPMAIFSNKVGSLKELKNKKGAVIAVPNDPTNEGRALLLLQSIGMISLNDSSNLSSTVADIATNRNGIVIREVEAASLPRMLSDVDAAVINGNYALSANLDVNKSVAIEGSQSPYVNIIAVRQGNENSAKTKALVAAIKNGKVKDFIASTYKKGEVICVL